MLTNHSRHRQRRLDAATPRSGSAWASGSKPLEYASGAAQRASHRERYLRKWFEHAKFRYAPTKARYARENFDQIESMGGGAAATRLVLQQRGRAAKIAVSGPSGGPPMGHLAR